VKDASPDPQTLLVNWISRQPSRRTSCGGLMTTRGGRRGRGLTRNARCRPARPSCCCASRRRPRPTPRRRRKRRGAWVGGARRERAARSRESCCKTPWPAPAKGKRCRRLGMREVHERDERARRRLGSAELSCGPRGSCGP
jgi:hypothetical protein